MLMMVTTWRQRRKGEGRHCNGVAVAGELSEHGGGAGRCC